MSDRERGTTRRLNGLAALACLACGLIVGAAYTSFAPPLAPFAPFALSGGWFALISAASAVALGLGIGHQRLRAVMLAALAVAALGSALFAALLVLPVFTPEGRNVIGLLNYALTQAAFAFFAMVVIVFPAAMVGMLADYLWSDR